MPNPLIEFPADDPERALRFWSGVLGVELEPRSESMGRGWEVDVDGLRLGVHERGIGPGDGVDALAWQPRPVPELAVDGDVPKWLVSRC